MHIKELTSLMHNKQEAKFKKVFDVAQNYVKFFTKMF
jgi:hypothetical protein